jgi:hypothetical protein
LIVACTGEANPHGARYPLRRACWDADAVRDDVRAGEHTCPASAGPSGDDATEPAHTPAIAGDKTRQRHEDHGLRPEY